MLRLVTFDDRNDFGPPTIYSPKYLLTFWRCFAVFANFYNFTSCEDYIFRVADVPRANVAQQKMCVFLLHVRAQQKMHITPAFGVLNEVVADREFALVHYHGSVWQYWLSYGCARSELIVTGK